MELPSGPVQLGSDRVAISDDDLIPLSHLSQYYYCPRRAGLIMLEQIWEENALTAEGEGIHARVHQHDVEVRPDATVLRRVHISSATLGVSGIADCIELLPSSGGVRVPGLEGKWDVSVIEYKHGDVRNEIEYEVQLCAQAMCIEEQMAVPLVSGHIFFAGDHRRKSVEFTTALRRLVEEGARALRGMLRSGNTPPASKGPKCRKCSMVEVCTPQINTRGLAYVKRMQSEAAGGAK